MGAEERSTLVDRIYSFRVIYVAIFAFLVLYVFTVKGAEVLLDQHFVAVAEEAVKIESLEESVILQLQSRIQNQIRDSALVRLWGVDVSIVVLARDGVTWLYVGDRAMPPAPTVDLVDIMREAWLLLPATPSVTVRVPHNSLLANAILVGYGTLLFTVLYFYNRAVNRREQETLDQAFAARDNAAARAESIEDELEGVRSRLLELEPVEQEQSREIRALQHERENLQRQLAGLARREEELRGKAARAVELDQEIGALEDLLDEAGVDLASKESEILDLEKNLKKVSKAVPARGRESDVLSRRLRTLYKNLEIDDRAIDDLVGLRDETNKLKAEESIKRLNDEAENVLVRRKVGGLPPQLSIFELGFAGKGRIYYTKGVQRRFRLLKIGAKNTQKVDLEYLSRLSL